MVNYNLLNEKIKDSGLRYKHIAEIVGVSNSVLSAKINGKRKLNLDDAVGLARALNLTRADVQNIFFADNVE